MDKMFEEIRQKLDELQAEVERLKTENTELRKQLANYNAIAEIITGKNPEKNVETVVEEKNDNAKLKEYVNGLAKSLVDHTAENEVQVITELMEHWRDNKPAKSSLVAIKRAIDSQALSEDCLEVICNFLVDEGNYEFGKIRKIPSKNYNLAVALLKADNLRADKFEAVLNIIFNVYWNEISDEVVFQNKKEHINFLWKKFEESNNYKVVELQRNLLRVKRA